MVKQIKTLTKIIMGGLISSSAFLFSGCGNNYYEESRNYGSYERNNSIDPHTFNLWLRGSRMPPGANGPGDQRRHKKLLTPNPLNNPRKNHIKQKPSDIDKRLMPPK